MRKSGVIAVVALGIGGVLVFALRPKRDWVEYHIRQYREAERKFTSPETFLDEVRDTLGKIRNKGIGRQGRLFYPNPSTNAVTAISDRSVEFRVRTLFHRSSLEGVGEVVRKGIRHHEYPFFQILKRIKAALCSLRSKD